MHIFDVKRLPFSRIEIGAALLRLMESEKDPKLRSNMGTGFLALRHYQPGVVFLEVRTGERTACTERRSVADDASVRSPGADSVSFSENTTWVGFDGQHVVIHEPTHRFLHA
jgi:hypothetical protein